MLHRLWLVGGGVWLFLSSLMLIEGWIEPWPLHARTRASCLEAQQAGVAASKARLRAKYSADDLARVALEAEARRLAEESKTSSALCREGLDRSRRIAVPIIGFGLPLAILAVGHALAWAFRGLRENGSGTEANR